MISFPVYHRCLFFTGISYTKKRRFVAGKVLCWRRKSVEIGGRPVDQRKNSYQGLPPISLPSSIKSLWVGFWDTSKLLRSGDFSFSQPEKT